MKRTLVIAALTVAAAVPATLGLIGNASFGQSVPVRIPPSAVVLSDDHGSDATATFAPTTSTLSRSTLTTVTVRPTPVATSRMHSSATSTTTAVPSMTTTSADDDRKTQEPGDDHASAVEPGDDVRNAPRTADDNGGRRASGSVPRTSPSAISSASTNPSVEPGDDQPSGVATNAGDQSSSRSDRGGDNGEARSTSGHHGSSGRGGEDDGAGHR